MLATLVALAPLAPAAGDAEGDAPIFTAFEKAWAARSAAGVVALVAPEGRLDLALLTEPPIRGSFQRAQAQRTLAGYFEKVAGISLKDVTPRDPDRPPPPGFRVRLYDYRYQPRGRDPLVTRLVVTLKADAEGSGWFLDSIAESPRPPPGQGG